MRDAKEQAAMNKSNDERGAGRGDTRTVQGETQQPVPRTPNERDESAGSQADANPSAQSMGRIAHDSVADGQVDTDKGPVLDATYDKVREGASQPVKQLRR
jgi:hypothetical protein